jgi:hypothetical protein
MELGIGNFLEKILTIDYLHSQSSTWSSHTEAKDRALSRGKSFSCPQMTKVNKQVKKLIS